MNGRNRDDTINVRVSAVAVSVTLMCAEMGMKMLDGSTQEFAFGQIASIAEAVKTEVAKKIVETAAAEKEADNGDEQNA